MNCVHPDIKNCQPDGICPNGYNCCSQRVPGGGKPTFGLCVKNPSKNCDVNLGLPVSTCRDEELGEYNGSGRMGSGTNRYMGSGINRYMSSNDIMTDEGYTENWGNDTDCECENWRNAFIVLLVIFSLLAVVLVKRR